MSRPAVRDDEALMRAWERRIKLLERRLAGGGSPTIGKGTPAQRDALYPPPTTAATRAALANSQPLWFNTSKGWTEMYYAVTGTAGLTVRGVWSGNTPGWYPITAGAAFITLQRNAALAVNSSAVVIPFDAVWAAHNFPFTSGASQVPVPFGGNWEVNATAVVSQTNGNYFDLNLRRSGTAIKAQTGTVFPHNVAYSRADLVPLIVQMTTAQYLDLYAASSSPGTIQASTALITIQYLGPPLA